MTRKSLKIPLNPAKSTQTARAYAHAENQSSALLPRPTSKTVPHPHFHVVARKLHAARAATLRPRRAAFRAFPKTFRDPPGASNQSFINMTSVDFIMAVPLLQLEFFGTAASSEAAVIECHSPVEPSVPARVRLDKLDRHQKWVRHRPT